MLNLYVYLTDTADEKVANPVHGYKSTSIYCL